MALAVWNLNQIIAQLDSTHHWSGSTITFSTSSTAALIAYDSPGTVDYNLEATTYTGANASQAAAATLAITLWDDIMPQSFVAVSEAAGTNANIDLAGFADDPANSNYAYTLPYYDGTTNALTKSSVWVNDAFNAAHGYVDGDLSNPQVSNYSFLTFMHELGHAIGLDHAGNYNGNVGSGPSSYQDSLVYSIMSYYGPNSSHSDPSFGVAWANWGTYEPQTPMLDDVLAIQSIYGVSTTTRVGDTTYGYGSNITGSEAAIFNFALNAHPIMCIFDSSGNDTLSLSGDTHNDVIDLHAGAFSSVMGFTYNISIAYSCNIESAVGGSGNDTIIGNDLGNLLYGGAGVDSITGGAGNDVVIGGFGADAINGGGGNNTLHYYDSAQAVTVNLASGTGSGGDAQGDTFVNFQNIYGSNLGNDLLIGDAAANVINGFGGDDLIYGGAGNDTICGGAGNDVVVGGAGADNMDGGSGSNTLHYYDSVQSVSVNLAAGTGLGGDAQGDTFTNFQNVYGSNTGGDLLVGDGNANVLYGFGSDDLIYGGGGNDIINGGGGNDVVVGGAGADNMDGGSGNNTLHYYDSVQGVTVNLAAGTGSGGDAQGDTFVNFQNVYGSNIGNDSFYGDGSANVLMGFGGNDVIVGYGGNDYLVGGSGTDTFVYNAISFGHDEIADFTIGQDKVAIYSAVATSFAALTFSASGANTIVSIGTDSIQLDGLTPAQLHASDFIFY